MKITVAFLKQYGACHSQIKLFEEVFPDGAPISEETARQAIAAGLDVFWLLGCLPSGQLDVYYMAIEEVRAAHETAVSLTHDAYSEATSAERAVYEKAIAAINEKYGEITASNQRAHDIAVNQAMCVFAATTKPALEKYHEGIGEALKVLNEGRLPHLVEAMVTWFNRKERREAVRDLMKGEKQG